MDHKKVITDEELELLEQMQTLEELGKHYDKAEVLKKALMIIGAYKQVRWERDIAISQLNELGYDLGEKIWKEFDLDNEELQDHYFYLVAHKDYGTPMKAKWHQDCPPTFQVYIGGGKCDEYIDELSNYHAEENKKITHWCKLPNLPKGSDE